MTLSVTLTIVVCLGAVALATDPAAPAPDAHALLTDLQSLAQAETLDARRFLMLLHSILEDPAESDRGAATNSPALSDQLALGLYDAYRRACDTFQVPMSTHILRFLIQLNPIVFGGLVSDVVRSDDDLARVVRVIPPADAVLPHIQSEVGVVITELYWVFKLKKFPPSQLDPSLVQQLVRQYAGFQSEYNQIFPHGADVAAALLHSMAGGLNIQLLRWRKVIVQLLYHGVRFEAKPFLEKVRFADKAVLAQILPLLRGWQDCDLAALSLDQPADHQITPSVDGPDFGIGN